MESEDLSNLRLVCHDFSAKAAPRLFEKMTVTFKTSTFSKPARIDALSRIGRHVKTFTFHMPHGPETCLPPIIDPLTGAEKQFIYEPQVQIPQHGPAKDKAPKYGSWEMQDLLIKQYPPLFHAATNVPAFCAAFSEMINLIHLKISCPGFTGIRHRRGVVDYALISLRIAIERAPLYSLSALSLHPIHPGGAPLPASNAWLR
ncbi:Fatty acid-binding [Pyrenophora seminiperda CCB06]|uniref:Fatty acid-binding n=1 Tax=Pyrenophora seminiperda CCB06 TaxID=1302712 RepID=A0A3M7LYP5_9PLEO|nr:Fatty acid-binding [Pyrenophora seminiperda CCB06]